MIEPEQLTSHILVCSSETGVSNWWPVGWIYHTQAMPTPGKKHHNTSQYVTWGDRVWQPCFETMCSIVTLYFLIAQIIKKNFLEWVGFFYLVFFLGGGWHLQGSHLPLELVWAFQTSNGPRFPDNLLPKYKPKVLLLSFKIQSRLIRYCYLLISLNFCRPIKHCLIHRCDVILPGIWSLAHK